MSAGEANISCQPSLEIEQGFAAYTRFTEKYGYSSPQHQGLTIDEFESALFDPLVCKSEVIEGDQVLRLPQLGPVDRNQWLNADFYKKQFPASYVTEDVLHYVDIPGVTPGKEVIDRLKNLGLHEGVVVFDYPLTDPGYPNRIAGLLEAAGVMGSEVQTLGNQTYFAGQTFLKRKDYPLPPPMSFSESYEKAKADGTYDTSRIDNGASLMSRVDEQQAEHMLRFYEAAYEVLSDHPCLQGLNPQEFHEMMTEKDWIPKVVNSVNGKIAALCILDNNLDELSWVNADFYRRKYPRETQEGKVMWFPGLAADPESDIIDNTKIMVELIAELGEIASNDITIVFDCCDKNTGLLDRLVQYTVNRTPYASVKFEKIAVQRYCAIQTSSKD
jgi:hypothetical protein